MAMRSRRACLGLLLLTLAGCGSPAAGGSSAVSPQGLVVVTAGGTALDDGTADVPPTLELGLEGAGLTPSMVSATLDGHPITLTRSSQGVTASVAPMAYASEHQLVIDVAGRPQQVIGFQVVDRTGMSAAAWRGGRDRSSARSSLNGPRTAPPSPPPSPRPSSTGSTAPT